MRAAILPTLAFALICGGGASAMGQIALPSPEPAPTKKAKAAPTEVKPSSPTPAKGGSTRVTLINVCADITLLVGLPAGVPIFLEVDGKNVGTVPYCDFGSFTVPSGARSVRVVRTTEVLDLGFGQRNLTFAPGSLTYIRARIKQYVDWDIVTPEVGKRFMDTISKHNGKK